MAKPDQPWRRHASERTAFEPAWSEGAQRTMIAFANTFGGTLCLGHNDRGDPVGLEAFEETEQAILSFAREAVEPDMSVLIRTKPLEAPEGRRVMAVQVIPGDDRPYAIKNKSWTNGGVFVRIGASTREASRSDILNMAADRIPWEERRFAAGRTFRLSKPSAFVRSRGCRLVGAFLRTLA